jgi:predicted aspartyl protease
MNSRVTSTRIPCVPVTVEIPEKRLTADFTALVDTGFNANVVVPHRAVANDVPALLYNDVRLADGPRITVLGYLGNVRIGSTTIGPILVLLIAA